MISTHALTSPRQYSRCYEQTDTIERNPVVRLNKGFKKGKFYNQQNDRRPLIELRPCTQQQTRFFSNSNDKQNMYYSDNRLLYVQSDCMKKQKSKPIQFSAIRRKLDYGDLTNSRLPSKGKSPSFTDIIRQSREKNMKSGSKAKPTSKQLNFKGKQTKQVASFNKLKARLLGQKIEHSPSAQQAQMVRVSFALNQNPTNASLNMQPTI